MSSSHRSHSLLRLLLVVLAAWAALPFFGVGVWSNAIGQRFFSTPYALGFLVVAFFVMHEFITPLPPKGRGRPPGEGQQAADPSATLARTV